MLDHTHDQTAIAGGNVESHQVDEAEKKFDDWANQFDKFDDDEYNPNSEHIQNAGHQGDHYDKKHWDDHYHTSHIENAGKGANSYNKYDSYHHYKNYNPHYPPAADQAVELEQDMDKYGRVRFVQRMPPVAGEEEEEAAPKKDEAAALLAKK